MFGKNSIVESQHKAEDAVREHQEDGFDRTKLPIAGDAVQGGVPMKYWITAGVLAVLLVGLLVIPQLLQKWLWMRQLDYAGVFWTLFSVKCGMAGVAFIGVFLFLWLNIRAAVEEQLRAGMDTTRQRNPALAKRLVQSKFGGFAFSGHVVMRSLPLIAAAVAAIFAVGFYTQWDTYLRFRYGSSCGFSDPVFGVDVGFYLFTLPFYRLLQGSLAFVTVLAIAGVVSPRVYFEVMRLKGHRQSQTLVNAVPHLSILLFILAAAVGWGYYLDRYGLLYSTMGVVYGVGYTAAHVTLIALWIMISVSAAACRTSRA